MIYVSSDQHFGHSNIIRFCNRPFIDVHSMNKHLTESWNKVVKPEDEVYVMGDFSFKMNRIRNVINLLNGKKYFIKGNHDKTNILNNLLNDKLIEWWKYNYEFSYEYKGKTYTFLLSHYPHYPSSDNIICLYGHIHEKILTDVINGAFNIGVDSIGYEPISIENIIEQYEKNKYENVSRK